VSATLWTGVAGVRGRFNIPNSAFFVPYYADIGAGGQAFTWQAYLRVGYATSLADFSIGYRTMSFHARQSSALLQKLILSGPMLAATFRF